MKSKKFLLPSLMAVIPILGSSFVNAVELSIEIANDSLARSSNSSTNTNADRWATEFRHKMVLLDNDGILVPIEQEKPTLTFVSPDYGRFEFSEDQTISATRVSVVSFKNTSTDTMSYRPTLFVSLCGFKFDANVDGSGTCGWLTKQDRLLHPVLSDYQYKFFAVDWDTHAENKESVSLLADVISDFLNARVDAWDVVLIGHSRGGIFAHDLSRRIVGHAKVKNLYTILLDPTAVPGLNDHYPLYKYENASTPNYGSLYYDGEEITDWDGYLSGIVGGVTISDRKVPGYGFYYYDQPHQKYASKWLDEDSSGYGFAETLKNIKAHKDKGSFKIDGDSGLEVVKISRPDDWKFDGDISVSGNQVHISGAVYFPDNPNNISIDTTVTKNSAEVSGSMGLTSSYAILQKDALSVSTSSLLGNYSSSITSSGISTHVTVGHFNTEANIGLNGASLELNFGPVHVDSDNPVSALCLGIFC